MGCLGALPARHWAGQESTGFLSFLPTRCFTRQPPGPGFFFFFFFSFKVGVYFEVEVSNTVHAVMATAACLSSRSAFDLPEPTVPPAR